MKARNLLATIREEFFKRIEQKTSWGKEELKLQYVEAERDALLYFEDHS